MKKKVSKIRSCTLLALVLFLAFPTMALAGGNRVLSTEGGRYVYGQVGDIARDQFMLDTKTGKLWRAVNDDDKNLILEPVPYLNFEIFNSAIRQKYTAVPFYPTKANRPLPVPPPSGFKLDGKKGAPDKTP